MTSGLWPALYIPRVYVLRHRGQRAEIRVIRVHHRDIGVHDPIRHSFGWSISLQIRMLPGLLFGEAYVRQKKGP